MTSLAERERTVLCDLLQEVGPAAPTLCGEWRAAELAAHLVVREGQPAAVGIAIAPLARWTAKAQRRLSQQPYTELVARLRHGPPRWSPARLPKVDVAINTLELFVHLEDVRRARLGWTERQLSTADQEVLWQHLRRRARPLLRRSTVGVTLASPTHVYEVVRNGSSDVLLSGLPSELVMYLHGRQQHCHVTLDGDPDAVAQFEATNLSV